MPTPYGAFVVCHPMLVRRQIFFKSLYVMESWIVPKWTRRMSEGWGTWGDVVRANVDRVHSASVSGPLDFILYGDSITACMYGYQLAKAPGCQAVWQKHFGDLHAVPLACAGDQIGNLVWRITEGGERPFIAPRVAGILIGINDLIGWGETGTAARNPSTKGRMEHLVRTMCTLMPETQVLILALTPCNGTDLRKKRAALNVDYAAVAARLNAEGFKVRFVDCAKTITAPNGGPVRKGILADGVHLTPAGHDVHLACLRKTIEPYIRAKTSSK